MGSVLILPLLGFLSSVAKQCGIPMEGAIIEGREALKSGWKVPEVCKVFPCSTLQATEVWGKTEDFTAGVC